MWTSTCALFRPYARPDGMALHFGTPGYAAATKGVQKEHVILEPRSRRVFDRVKGRLKDVWVLFCGTSNGLAIDWPDASNTRYTKEIVCIDSIDNVNLEIMRYNSFHPETPKDQVRSYGQYFQ